MSLFPLFIWGFFPPVVCATGAVELMRTMMAKSKKQGHLYPMAMYSWEVMPPPASLEKNLGERRLTGYAGTGWHLPPRAQQGVRAKCWQLTSDSVAERQLRITLSAVHGVTCTAQAGT